MKKLLKRIWELPTRIWCAVSLVLASLLAGVWRYWPSYARLWLALRDFGGAMRIWFRAFLAGFRGAEIEPIRGAHLPMDSFDVSEVATYLPEWVSNFKGVLSNYFSDLFDLWMFGQYNSWLFLTLYRVLFYGVYLVLALWLLFYTVKDSILTDKEKPVGSFSKPLECFVRFLKGIIVPT